MKINHTFLASLLAAFLLTACGGDGSSSSTGSTDTGSSNGGTSNAGSSNNGSANGENSSNGESSTNGGGSSGSTPIIPTTSKNPLANLSIGPQTILRAFQGQHSYTDSGVTHTLSNTGNSWSITQNGTDTFDDITYDNWVAHTYVEEPSAGIVGIWTSFYENTTNKETEMIFYNNGRTEVKEYDESGALKGEELLIAINDNDARIVRRKSSGTYSVDVIVGQNYTEYYGCTADRETLANGNYSSCKSAQ